MESTAGPASTLRAAVGSSELRSLRNEEWPARQADRGLERRAIQPKADTQQQSSKVFSRWSDLSLTVHP